MQTVSHAPKAASSLRQSILLPTSPISTASNVSVELETVSSVIPVNVQQPINPNLPYSPDSRQNGQIERIPDSFLGSVAASNNSPILISGQDLFTPVPSTSPELTVPPDEFKYDPNRRLGPYRMTVFPRARPDRTCAFCHGGKEIVAKTADRTEEIKQDVGRELNQKIACYECGSMGHIGCLDWTGTIEKKLQLYEKVKSEPWCCVHCKRCEICDLLDDPDGAMLLCDKCDTAWHRECIVPPPNDPDDDEFEWECPTCVNNGFYPFPKKHYPLPADVIANNMKISKRKIQEHNSSKDKKQRLQEALDGEPTIKKLTLKVSSSLKTNTPTRPSKSSTPNIPYYILQEQQRNAERENMEPDSNPVEQVSEDEELYGGVLNAEDAAQADRVISPNDRQMFEDSMKEAYSQFSSPFPLSASHLISNIGPSNDTITLSPIARINIGRFSIKTWYTAPFPDEFRVVPNGCLHICEFCLKPCWSHWIWQRHLLKCQMKQPPGDEIYRDGDIRIWEVDGRKNKIYCQHLCLLSKMFLDHKTLYYDVEPFVFYIITINEQYSPEDSIGAKFVGYFSKEKASITNNLSCIMTLPVRQRKGWGGLLIDLSYLLSKKEARVGSPERPLSELGALSYKQYWTLAIYRYFDTLPDNKKVTLEDISSHTSITVQDIFEVLDSRDHIKDLDVMFPELTSEVVTPNFIFSFNNNQGVDESFLENGVNPAMLMSPPPSTLPSKAPPDTARKRGRPPRSRTKTQENDGSAEQKPIPKHYEIIWDEAAIGSFLDKWNAKGYLSLKPENLRWTPFILPKADVDPRAEKERKKRERERKRLEKLKGTEASTPVESVTNGVNNIKMHIPGKW